MTDDADKIEAIRIDVAVIKQRLTEFTPHHPPCFELLALRKDADALEARVRELAEREKAREQEAKEREKETSRRKWDALLRAAPWLLTTFAGLAAAALAAGWRPQ